MAKGKTVTITRGQVFERGDGWRFRAKAANGEVVAVGESYKRKADAVAALKALGLAIEAIEGA
jgi:hypothetical protein